MGSISLGTVPGVECMTNHDEVIDKYLDILPEGDFAEFGCYEGLSGAKLALRYKRKTWMFDTFEGIPKEDYIEALDYKDPPGKFKPHHDVITYLTTIPNVVIMKGRFIETLPQIPADTKFAYVYMDCDYYLSYLQVLQYLTTNHHLQDGTLLIFDDYIHCDGATKAVDEWRKTMPLVDTRALLYNRKVHLAR